MGKADPRHLRLWRMKSSAPISQAFGWPRKINVLKETHPTPCAEAIDLYAHICQACFGLIYTHARPPISFRLRK